ncbi:HEPN domain-containing protein [Actinobacillus equuli]|uniref:HEPN domain-containing protein n=1 Tax=Actinobacillus equuli TaxID=718 RepID=UPI002441F47C|nr:HEPN domain-containing protein [Actinobacillus equuli]WGE85618.1 HEPN domain-containing protein [Actinobacillus equuli subsp. haemolyticus]
MYFERERIELPENVVQGNQIDIDWLKTATPEEQYEALYQWFTNQYEDPAESLPYVSREGGYIPIHGALVDPFDEFWEFGDIVSGEVINSVAQELYDIAGDMWSPIYDPIFDEYTLPITPLEAFRNRIKDVNKLRNSLSAEDENYFLLHISVFSLLFTAFETYLWEITKYHLNNNNLRILKNLILNNKKDDIKNKSFSLIQRYYKKDIEDIFSELELVLKRKLDNEIIWHNQENIEYVFKQGFGLQRLPNYQEIRELLRVRNHIIHRFGMNIEGQQIDLPELDKAILSFTRYCESLDQLIQNKVTEISLSKVKR